MSANNESGPEYGVAVLTDKSGSNPGVEGIVRFYQEVRALS